MIGLGQGLRLLDMSANQIEVLPENLGELRYELLKKIEDKSTYLLYFEGI